MFQLFSLENDQRNRYLLNPAKRPGDRHAGQMAKPRAFVAKAIRSGPGRECISVQSALEFLNHLIRYASDELRSHLPRNEFAVVVLDRPRQVQRAFGAAGRDEHRESSDNEGGQTAERHAFPTPEKPAARESRAQSQLPFLPKRGRGLAGAQDAEQTLVESFLPRENFGALGARLQVELNLLARFGIEFRVEVRHDQIAGVVALHNADLRWKRTRASCIFFRARARWPITLPIGISSDSAISR